MGLTLLVETDNELRLPVAVSDNLSREEIVFLETRLCEHLGNVPVVSFKDLSMNIFRILRMPEMQRSVSNSNSSLSPALSPESAASPSSSNILDNATRQYGKKSKIPRPPNAFILYRQKHHPLIKAQNPDLHNNDISVILGQQWKNEETAVRNKFKALADELKHQHMVKFPGYQYAPRKSSEKKRRMTARKLAKMHEDNVDLDHIEGVAASTSDTDNLDDFTPRPPKVGIQITHEQHPSLAHILGVARQGTALTSSTTENISGQNAMDEFISASSALQNGTHLNNAATAASATAPLTPPNSTTFMNSIIDWDAVDAATQFFDNTGPASSQPDVIQTQNDHHSFTPLTDAEYLAYEEELERTLHLFE